MTLRSRMELFWPDQGRKKRFQPSVQRPFGPCDPSMRRFFVGNPITGKWRKLPPAPVSAALRFPCFNLAFEHNITSYTYRIAVSPSLGGGIAVYDSENGKWEIGQKMDWDEPTVDATVLLNGNLFLLCFGAVTRVLVFNLTNMTLFNVAMASLPDEGPAGIGTRYGIHGENLFNYEERGVVLMPSIYGHFGERLGFTIWELSIGEAQHQSWKLLSSLSFSDAFGESCEVDARANMKMQLVGDWIIFSCWYKNASFGMLAPVAYNLANSMWRPYLKDEAENVDYDCSYAFQPNLAARP